MRRFNPHLLLLNVQSLNNSKIGNLELEYIHYNKELQFICLTETWTTAESVTCLHIKDFVLASSYSRAGSRGGGVAIWTRSDLMVKAVNVSDFCIDKHSEMCAIEYVYKKNKTIILNCYRSPCGDLHVFFNSLFDVLDSLFKLNINFIVCGDFNIDSKCNNFVDLCNLMSNFNLKPLVGWPTRLTDTVIP